MTKATTMRHIIPISGKDSLATAIVQTTIEPNLNYEFMFNPTGSELPEVFEWINRVEKHLGKPIIRVGDNLRDIIEHEFNWFLPSHDKRYCTRMAKIEPMENFIGKDQATVYYGIRSDENRLGYTNFRKQNIVAVNPLVKFGIGIQGVYEINNNSGLKPPTFFWKMIYDEVCTKVGESYIIDNFKEWEIDAMFAWRSRANCFHCFNQRLYEWCGLLSHYPNLFHEANSWEHNVSEFYFAGKEKPLTWIIENYDRIVEKRIKKLTKFLNDSKQQKLKFDDDEDFIDILGIKSCGLLCGK